MGLWIIFIFAATLFALMGWSVYSTHRESPTETLQDLRSPIVGRLDAIDVLIVLVSWTVFPLIPIPGSDQLSETQYALLVGVLSAGSPAPAVLLRRRFFPSTVIRFHRKNLGLRCGAIFFGLLSLTALAFGFVARLLEKSSFLAWSFFLTAGFLLVFAVWFHMIEFRRRPRESPEA